MPTRAVFAESVTLASYMRRQVTSVRLHAVGEQSSHTNADYVSRSPEKDTHFAATTAWAPKKALLYSTSSRMSQRASASHKMCFKQSVAADM